MAEVPASYRQLWKSGRKRAAAFAAGARDFDAIFRTTVWTRIVPMQEPELFDQEKRRWDPVAFDGSLAQRASDKVFRELFVNGEERR